MAQVIDLKAVEEMKELMGDQYEMLVETYLRNADHYAAVIQEGYKEQDARKIKDAAHPLKSSSRNLGLRDLSNLGISIELKAKAVEEGEEEFIVLDPDCAIFADTYEKARAALLLTMAD